MHLLHHCPDRSTPIPTGYAARIHADTDSAIVGPPRIRDPSAFMHYSSTHDRGYATLMPRHADTLVLPSMSGWTPMLGRSARGATSAAPGLTRADIAHSSPTSPLHRSTAQHPRRTPCQLRAICSIPTLRCLAPIGRSACHAGPCPSSSRCMYGPSPSTPSPPPWGFPSILGCSHVF